ncbi:hypothetical protein GH810_09870 [Acetobacterium paludosum]|uniref:Uncharacterized protein n=1 Tax=Acetobacterium paludosum TaxID=52693 RepID=A0A923I3X8_9FIRM|nr:hypothetical protein [Acetobacterium paludosum]MBC3888615.1 hypothetical protein [Acetobacterium paludosum]
MPKINRIRISNITFDKKRIIDELYSTSDGENVLINLANGSGKSVLVQLMLQTILPKVKIHGRSVESYLPSDRSTAYVMLEWKLDNTVQPAYFLTGIAMCLGGNDENNSRLKYFTFTNDYTQANEFDIANIPLIEKTGKFHKYCSYETAMKLMRQSEESRVRYFPSDLGEDYRKHLAQHGVFTNEWKIIARINEQEGGVDELFKKSSTSDKLVDDWILKTITDSMEASNDLQEMFVALMKAVMEENENIKNKELLTNFNDHLVEYEKKVGDLLASLTKAEDLETQFKELYHYCQKQGADAQQKILACHEKLNEIRIQEEHIKYERISEAYYEKRHNFSNLMESLEDRKQGLLDASERHRCDKRTREIYETAEISHDLDISKGELSLWIQRQEALSSEERSEKLQNIGYTLSEVYQQLKRTIQKQRDENNNCLMTTKSTETGLINRINQITGEQMENHNASGSLAAKCKSFKNEEEKIFRELKIFINRLLNNRLDESEVASQREKYDDLIQKNNDDYRDLKNRQDIVKQRISELDEALVDDRQQLNTAEKNSEMLALDKKRYLEKRVVLLEILSEYEIGPEREFSKAFNSQDVKERKRDLNVVYQKLGNRIEKQKELMAALEKGIIHTSTDLTELFQKENIEFETGEQYLNKETEGRRKMLLQKNPVIPYCYLVGKNELERVMNLKLSEPMMRIIPILSFEDIETDQQPVNEFVRWNKGVLACHYLEKCFNTDQRQKFKTQIENALATMESEQKNRETTLTQISQDLIAIAEYPYEKGYLKAVEDQLAAIRKEIIALNTGYDVLAAEKRALTEEMNDIPDRLARCQQDQDLLKRQQLSFESYLLMDKQYGLDFSQHAAVQQRLLDLEKEKTRLTNQKETVLKKIGEFEELERGYQTKSEEYKKKINQFSNFKNGELLNDDVVILERQFEDLQSERSSTKQEIDRNIQKINQDISKHLHKLMRFNHISPEEYIDIILDDLTFDRLVKREDEASTDLENAKNEQSKAETSVRVAEVKVEAESKRLTEIGHEAPLPMDEIKGNYLNRKKDLETQAQEISGQEHHQQGRKTGYEKKIAAVEKIIEIPEHLCPLRLSNEAYESLDIQTMSKEIKETRDNNNNLQRELFQNYLTIKSEYEGKHSIISSLMARMDTSGLKLKFEDYYFVYEELTNSRKRLNDYLLVIESALRTIDEDTKHINQHAIEHGKKIHQEMILIAKSAAVKLEGRRTAQPMLSLDIPEQLDNYYGDRMKEHIAYCVEIIRKECESSDNIEEIVRKKVKILFSDRKIFNIIIDKESLKVKLYKADISVAASELRLWEEVLVGNSGGQMFISCFAMISALIDYTRNKAMESSGFEKYEASKAFIIDNPFGKMSSFHLLDVLLKIAEKFNSQMICLSDLSQSSITTIFPVIYQLKLQKAKYSNQAYLQTTDSHTRNDVYRNEKLEHAFLKSKQVQINLFDF